MEKAEHIRGVIAEMRQRDTEFLTAEIVADAARCLPSQAAKELRALGFSDAHIGPVPDDWAWLATTRLVDLDGER